MVRSIGVSRVSVSKQEQKVRRVRGQVRQAVRAIGQGASAAEVATAQSCVALREIAALREEVGDDKAFRVSLKRVGFDSRGVDLIVQGLDDQQSFQRGTLAQIARVPLPDITTERLNVALMRHMATPECRRELTRPARGPLTPGEVDASHEFAPFLVWILSADVFPKVKAEALARLVAYIRSGHAARDLTSTDPEEASVQALRAVVARLRAGEAVAPQAVDEVLSQRFAELFAPVKVLRQDECAEGLLPIAVPATASSFSLFPQEGRRTEAGAVEGSGMIDAIIRDAVDPTRWHMAAATANDDTTSQADQLARHHAAVRNSMDMNIPPFQENDTLASLFFVSPSFLTPHRQSALEETGPTLTGAECEALNALALYAQMGQQINAKQMDPAAVMRFEHLAIGGVSAASGGLGRTDSQLATAAAAQFARATLALGHPKRTLRLEGSGSQQTLLILNMVQNTGNALASHHAADAEHGLRLAAPALRRLSAQASDQGQTLVGDQLLTLASRIEAIGPAQRERRLPERRRPQDADRAPLMAMFFKGLDREQQFAHLQAQNDWSPGVHQRWQQAREKASEGVWSALVQGALPIQDLDAHRSGVGPVLDLSPASQGQWLRHHKAQSKDRTLSHASARFFEREPDAQRLRATAPLSVAELSSLPHLQRHAAPAVWTAVISQAVPVATVVDALSPRGAPILDQSESQQQRWLAQHQGEPIGVRKRLLEAEPVSEQHAAFLKTVRPALHAGLLSDSMLHAFDRVAQAGSVRLYAAVMQGQVSALKVTQGQENGVAVLDLPKQAQNAWLRETLDHRVRQAPAEAAVIIQEAAENQRHRRRSRVTR